MGLQRVGHDWATELNWTEALFRTFWFISYTMDLSIINLSKNHSTEVSINYFYFENDINTHFCFYEIGDFRFYFTVLFSLSKKSTAMSWENEFFISDSKYITKLFQFYRFGCSLWSSQAHIHHRHTPPPHRHHTHTQSQTFPLGAWHFYTEMFVWIVALSSCGALYNEHVCPEKDAHAAIRIHQ